MSRKKSCRAKPRARIGESKYFQPQSVAVDANDVVAAADSPVGLRFNAGKLRFDLIPWIANEALAEVLTLGAQKYAPRNWEKGMKWQEQCLASMDRHLHAFRKGEDLDPESGKPHLWHAFCNLAFLIEYRRTGAGVDDRVK